MKKDISRRDFFKMVGVGATSVVLGENLVGFVEVEEEKMSLDRLSEYHVFKQPINDVEGLDNYLFIREQRYLDNYMYFVLNTSADKYFYDTVLITLEGDDDINLDVKAQHEEFKPLLEYFNMTDLGNAVDVVGNEIGIKKEYSANEISSVSNLLIENNNEKKLVKTM